MLINLKLVFVVVNFLISGNSFCLLLGIVMYANKLETKEKITITRVKKINCNIYVNYSFRQKVMKPIQERNFVQNLRFFSVTPLPVIFNSLTGKQFRLP